MVSKKEFLKYIKFIQEKQKQQQNLTEILEKMCPGFRCDALVYCDYETIVIKLLENMFEDKTELISYKLYEFDSFCNEDKIRQIKETPEVETWETVYDYLKANLEVKKNED